MRLSPPDLGLARISRAGTRVSQSSAINVKVVAGRGSAGRGRQQAPVLPGPALSDRYPLRAAILPRTNVMRSLRFQVIGIHDPGAIDLSAKAESPVLLS